MRIGIDGRSLTGPSRGVAVYLRQLLEAMAGTHPGDERVLLVPGRGPLTPPPGCTVRRVFAPSRVVHGLAALAGRPRLDRMLAPCDVLWAPAVAPLARSRATPLVLTVHDLSFERRPADYSRYERLWHRVARPAALARAAAPRDHRLRRREARRVQEMGACRPSRWSRCGPDPGARRSTAAARHHRCPPGMCSRWARSRRARRPISSWPRMRARGPRACALRSCWQARAPGGARSRARTSRCWGVFPDEQMPALYAGALALVCASSDEGFGFTPLEALAQGTPVVVADLPVFRETLGDAAHSVCTRRRGRARRRAASRGARAAAQGAAGRRWRGRRRSPLLAASRRGHAGRARRGRRRGK